MVSVSAKCMAPMCRIFLACSGAQRHPKQEDAFFGSDPDPPTEVANSYDASSHEQSQYCHPVRQILVYRLENSILLQDQHFLTQPPLLIVP